TRFEGRTASPGAASAAVARTRAATHPSPGMRAAPGVPTRAARPAVAPPAAQPATMLARGSVAAPGPRLTEHGAVQPMRVSFRVNGQAVTIDVPPDMPLLWALRDEL